MIGEWEHIVSGHVVLMGNAISALQRPVMLCFVMEYRWEMCMKKISNSNFATRKRHVHIEQTIIYAKKIFNMKLINFHYNTKNNINKYYLAQHVEWQYMGNDLVLYNTLFDSVVIAKPKSIESGIMFVKALEDGCDDIISLIKNSFIQSPKAVYSLLVNKKIIE